MTEDENGTRGQGQPERIPGSKAIDLRIGPAQDPNGNVVVLIQLEFNDSVVSLPLTPAGATKLAERIVDVAGHVQNLQAAADTQRKAARN